MSYFNEDQLSYLKNKAEQEQKRLDRALEKLNMGHNSSHEDDGLDYYTGNEGVKEKELVVGKYEFKEFKQSSTKVQDLPDLKFIDVKVTTQNQPTLSPKKEAMRFNDNKMRFDLIPAEGLLELARVYTVGAAKYDDNNWRKGMPFSKCIASLERHWNLWKSGKEVDKEMGTAHLAQVAWNAFTLLTYCLTKTGTDDRVKFAIDEKFNLVDNHLGIGLSDEELTKMKDKYKSQREKSK